MGSPMIKLDEEIIQSTLCRNCSVSKRCLLFRFFDETPFSSYVELNSFKLKKNDILLNEFEPAKYTGVVCRGMLKEYKIHKSGQFLTTRILTPGDIFGYESCLLGTTYQINLRAIRSSVVIKFPFVEFQQLLKHERKEELKYHIQQYLTNEHQFYQEQALCIAYDTARDKIIGALKYLYYKQNKSRFHEPETIILPRQEIAELTSLTKETVVRELKKLERNEYLKLSRDSITLLSPILKEDSTELSL